MKPALQIHDPEGLTPQMAAFVSTTAENDDGAVYKEGVDYEVFNTKAPYNVIGLKKPLPIKKTALKINQTLFPGDKLFEIHCNKTSAGFSSFLPKGGEYITYSGMIDDYALFKWRFPVDQSGLVNGFAPDRVFICWRTFGDIDGKDCLFYTIRGGAGRVIEADGIKFERAAAIAKNDDAGSSTTKNDDTAASSKTAVLNASYPGGKRGAGVYQALINLIPPHTTYIETHLGGGAVLRNKLPAAKNIGIDVDPDVCDGWRSFSVPEACTIINGDAVKFLSEYAFAGDEFVYCDPPYLSDCRVKRNMYNYEYSDDQHRELLSVIKALPCCVMISGYWSDLYAQELDGWNTHSFSAQTRGGPRTEFVWMNYPAPLELHDYRYLGDGYRERERIKRKRMRWVAKLEKMPHLERQALLSAITEVFK